MLGSNGVAREKGAGGSGDAVKKKRLEARDKTERMAIGDLHEAHGPPKAATEVMAVASRRPENHALPGAGCRCALDGSFLTKSQTAS